MVNAVEERDGWICEKCGGAWETEEEADACCQEEVDSEENNEED